MKLRLSKASLNEGYINIIDIKNWQEKNKIYYNCSCYLKLSSPNAKCVNISPWYILQIVFKNKRGRNIMQKRYSSSHGRTFSGVFIVILTALVGFAFLPSIILSRSESSSLHSATNTLPKEFKFDSHQLLQPQQIDNATLKIADPNFVVYNPKFSYFSDKYLFATLIDGKYSGLWLASLSQGIEKQLLASGSVIYQWAFDDQHILYSALSTSVKDSANTSWLSPQDLVLLDVESGKSEVIGKTTHGWSVKALANGDIAFLNDDTLQVVNPLSGVKREVLSILSVGHEAVVSITVPIQNQEKEVSFLLTPTPGPPLVPPTNLVVEGPNQSLSAMYPNVDVRFTLSPDGKKAIVHQINNGMGSLVLEDIDSQKSTLLTNDAESSWYPADWSPDGLTLAYTVIPPTTRSPELWLTNADGTNQVMLFKDEGGIGWYEYVTWLPDNKHITYIWVPPGTDRFGSAEYRVVNINEKKPSNLFVGGATIQLFNQGQSLYFYRQSILPIEQRVDYSKWIVGLTAQ